MLWQPTTFNHLNQGGVVYHHLNWQFSLLRRQSAQRNLSISIDKEPLQNAAVTDLLADFRTS